jgi:hypothetical protein
MVTTNHNSYYNSNGMGNGDIHQVLSPPYAIQNVALDLQPYVLDRGNGQFTRLIPADTLPPLNEVPAREASAEGKVVLQPISPSERRLTLKVSLLLARVLLHIFQRETQHVSPHLGSDEVQVGSTTTNSLHASHLAHLVTEAASYRQHYRKRTFFQEEKRQDLLRQMGSRRRLCFRPAGLSLQARDAHGQGDAAHDGTVPRSASLVAETAGRDTPD